MPRFLHSVFRWRTACWGKLETGPLQRPNSQNWVHGALGSSTPRQARNGTRNTPLASTGHICIVWGTIWRHVFRATSRDSRNVLCCSKCSRCVALPGDGNSRRSVQSSKTSGTASTLNIFIAGVGSPFLKSFSNKQPYHRTVTLPIWAGNASRPAFAACALKKGT